MNSAMMRVPKLTDDRLCRFAPNVTCHRAHIASSPDRLQTPTLPAMIDVMEL